MIQKQGTNDPGYYSPDAKLAFEAVSLEEERELFRRYREEEDLGARDTIITNHLLHVAKIALKLAPDWLEEDEVISAANIGLLKALQKFNYKLGNRFAGYVRKFVRGEVIRLCRSKNVVHTPSAKPPAPAQPLPEKNFEKLSVDGDPLVVNHSYSDEEYREHAARKIRLALRRKWISPIERHVIVQHHFRGRGYEEIGKTIPKKFSEVPLSRQRIGQLHKKACEKLKVLLRQYGIEWVL